MISKNQTVRLLCQEGNYKEALKIASKFKHQFDSEQSKQLQIGFECMHFPRFYVQLGYVPETETRKAIQILNDHYGL